MRAAVAGAGFQSGIENPLFQFGRQHLGSATPPPNASNRLYPVPGKGGAKCQDRRTRQIQLLSNGLIGDTLMSK
jgi:hypothetical protein